MDANKKVCFGKSKIECYGAVSGAASIAGRNFTLARSIAEVNGYTVQDDELRTACESCVKMPCNGVVR